MIEEQNTEDNSNIPEVPKPNAPPLAPQADTPTPKADIQNFKPKMAKIPEINKEQQELKDLLARGEVRTMQKDIAHLRERDALQERDRVASLATEDEVKIEQVKREQNLIEAEERKKAEEEFLRKSEESLKRAEEERLARVMEESRAEKKDGIFKDIGEETKEAWMKEETERDKFLKKVNDPGETEKKPLPEIPLPPPMPKEILAPPIPNKENSGLFMPEPPKRSSSFSKLLVRGGLGLGVILLLLVAGFAYWYFAVRNPGNPPIIPPGENLPPQQQIVIPPSLILTQATQTIEIVNSQELPPALFQFIEKKTDNQGFTRILIKDTKKNQILGLKEFFSAFEIKTPDGLTEKLDNSFTLFSYPQKEGNRLGFVAKIKNKEGLNDMLSVWEKSMEGDTEKLFSGLGKQGPALVSYFKGTEFKGSPFRYLTINREDFGICYAIDGDYLIFTSSFLSMNKAMEAVESKKIETNAGQLFIIGFEGKTVSPQLEKIFAKYRPGGVLLLAKNIGNAEQLKKLTQDLQELSLKETGLPLLIAVDQEGGLISRVKFAKEKTPQSEINSANEAYLVSKRRGEELKDLGINLDLAPVLDVVAKGDFLFSRTFRADALESGILAKSLISGQKATGMLTAIKHFPGYGGITTNPEEQLIQVEKTPEISPFKEAIGADPEFVMISNVVYKDIDPSLPFTFSAKAIQFTRENLGQDVLIISDDLAQNSLLNNFSLKDVVVKPVQAGVDVLIFSGWNANTSQALDAFYAAVNSGEISPIGLNESIAKIIKLKEKLMIQESLFLANKTI